MAVPDRLPDRPVPAVVATRQSAGEGARITEKVFGRARIGKRRRGSWRGRRGGRGRAARHGRRRDAHSSRAAIVPAIRHSGSGASGEGPVAGPGCGGRFPPRCGGGARILRDAVWTGSGRSKTEAVAENACATTAVGSGAAAEWHSAGHGWSASSVACALRPGSAGTPSHVAGSAGSRLAWAWPRARRPSWWAPGSRAVPPFPQSWSRRGGRGA